MNIAVTKWGETGERIILVHGGVQGSKARGTDHFPAQQQLVTKGFQLLVPDRPGHGLSPSPNRGDDSQKDAEWLAEMLGDGVHLVGHSFGGAVALAATARRPDAVKTLTLIEPGMQAIAVNHFAVIRFVARLVLAQKLPGSDEARIKRFAELMHIPPERGGAVADADEARAMGEAMKKLVPPARGDLLRELALVRERKIPFLVVSGGWAPGVDLTAMEAAKLGGGEHVIIKSPHHFPHLISEEFNERLVKFMAARRDR